MVNIQSKSDKNPEEQSAISRLKLDAVMRKRLLLTHCANIGIDTPIEMG